MIHNKELASRLGSRLGKVKLHPNLRRQTQVGQRTSDNTHCESAERPTSRLNLRFRSGMHVRYPSERILVQNVCSLIVSLEFVHLFPKENQPKVLADELDRGKWVVVEIRLVLRVLFNQSETDIITHGLELRGDVGAGLSDGSILSHACSRSKSARHSDRHADGKEGQYRVKT